MLDVRINGEQPARHPCQSAVRAAQGCRHLFDDGLRFRNGRDLSNVHARSCQGRLSRRVAQRKTGDEASVRRWRCAPSRGVDSEPKQRARRFQPVVTDRSENSSAADVSIAIAVSPVQHIARCTPPRCCFKKRCVRFRLALRVRLVGATKANHGGVRPLHAQDCPEPAAEQPCGSVPVPPPVMRSGHRRKRELIVAQRQVAQERGERAVRRGVDMLGKLSTAAHARHANPRVRVAAGVAEGVNSRHTAAQNDAVASGIGSGRQQQLPNDSDT